MKSRSIALLVGATISILLLHISPAGAASERVVYSFCSTSCEDGAQPRAGVLRFKDELYVAASSGGENGWGTLVAIDKKTGTGRVVYSFENYAGDARRPSLL